MNEETEMRARKMNESTRADYEGWVLELYPGKFLKKVLEGGDFIDTYDITEAKMVDNVETLVNIVDTIYVDFDQIGDGYPKFHKIRLTADVLDTFSYDDIA